MSALRPVLCAKAARCPLGQHCRRNPAVSGVVDGDVFGQWTPLRDAAGMLDVFRCAEKGHKADGAEAGAHWVTRWIRSEACDGFLGLGEA